MYQRSVVLDCSILNCIVVFVKNKPLIVIKVGDEHKTMRDITQDVDLMLIDCCYLLLVSQRNRHIHVYNVPIDI